MGPEGEEKGCPSLCEKTRGLRQIGSEEKRGSRIACPPGEPVVDPLRNPRVEIAPSQPKVGVAQTACLREEAGQNSYPLGVGQNSCLLGVAQNACLPREDLQMVSRDQTVETVFPLGEGGAGQIFEGVSQTLFLQAAVQIVDQAQGEGAVQTACYHRTACYRQGGGQIVCLQDGVYQTAETCL